METKYQEYFSSLSTPDLLRVTFMCQQRYEEGKVCADCHLFIQDRCDGRRVNDEYDKEFSEDLHLEQTEQM